MIREDADNLDGVHSSRSKKKKKDTYAKKFVMKKEAIRKCTYMWHCIDMVHFSWYASRATLSTERGE